MTESGTPQLTEIDGIDLSNYVRDPNSYNPIVYIHERNLKRCMTDGEDGIAPKMHNKGQQFNFGDENRDTYNINVVNNDDIQDQTAEKTIHFAKTLIPIAIPPKSEDENVYYTIKSTKKSRSANRGCKCNLDSTIPQVQTAQKGKTERKAKQYFKPVETITQSSENTIQNSDDTNNQTLSELSEFYENKLKESPNIPKQETTKFIPSQSFEALAEKYQDVGKIKIQIMNDKERQTLYENICIPLVNAVKDSISPDEFNKGLVAIKNKVDKFVDKLDGVLERLNNIEEKLSNGVFTYNRTMLDSVPANTSPKEEDNSAERDRATERDLISIKEGRKIKRRQGMDDISIRSIERDFEGKGERVPESLDASSSLRGIAPTPVHRLPARFCWTDTKLQ